MSMMDTQIVPRAGLVHTWFKRCDEEDTLGFRWHKWKHNVLCGKLWVRWLGVYTCSEFCSHKIRRSTAELLKLL